MIGAYHNVEVGKRADMNTTVRYLTSSSFLLSFTVGLDNQNFHIIFIFVHCINHSKISDHGDTVKLLIRGHLYTVKPLIRGAPLYSEASDQGAPLYSETSDQGAHIH